MRVTYHRERFSDPIPVTPNGRFRVALELAGQEIDVTLDAEDVLNLITLLAKTKLLDRPAATTQNLYPKRQLLGQRRPLKMLPTSPHARYSSTRQTT